jgi:pimeloyl-ACP methyl ester carboxylesterase
MQRGYVQVDRGRIYYQVAGSGRPVVLVHGLSGSTRWWSRNIAAFAERFRVYVLDLIGFGASRDGLEFVLSEAAYYLTKWMDALGIDGGSLVGHSMGGFIAADLAARFPERVERLVLVDAAVLPFERRYWQQALGLIEGLWRMPLGFLPVLLTDAYRSGPRTLLKAAHQLLTTDARPQLARIQAPTLVVWGEHDAILPLELGQRVTACVPEAELVVIAGAGHNPMWDRPEEFNRVVVQFLAVEREAPRRTIAASTAA